MPVKDTPLFRLTKDDDRHPGEGEKRRRLFGEQLAQQDLAWEQHYMDIPSEEQGAFEFGLWSASQALEDRIIFLNVKGPIGAPIAAPTGADMPSTAAPTSAPTSSQLVWTEPPTPSPSTPPAPSPAPTPAPTIAMFEPTPVPTTDASALASGSSSSKDNTRDDVAIGLSVIAGLILVGAVAGYSARRRRAAAVGRRDPGTQVRLTSGV